MLNIGGIQARSFYRRIGTLPWRRHSKFKKDAMRGERCVMPEKGSKSLDGLVSSIK